MQHSNSHSNAVLSARPSSPSGRSGGVYGRTELAQMYFPYIQPQTAWQKLRGLLATDPALVHLTKLKRRTFLPAEVNIIYQHLGQPWAAFFSAFQPLRVSCHETPTFIRPKSHFPACKLQVSKPQIKAHYFAMKNVKTILIENIHTATLLHCPISKNEVWRKAISNIYYIIYIL